MLIIPIKHKKLSRRLLRLNRIRFKSSTGIKKDEGKSLVAQPLTSPSLIPWGTIVRKRLKDFGTNYMNKFKLGGEQWLEVW